MSSSGGWEKVGGGRGGAKGGVRKGGGGGAAKKGGQNRSQTTTNKQPKLEDVLPITQLSMLQSIMPEEDPDPEQQEAPRPKAKAPQPQGAKKRDSGEKKDQPRLPKTVEEASKKVSPAELQNLLTMVRTRYPNNGILWLKDAASYFNVALNSEESVDLSSPFSNQPLSLLTKETRRILTSTYEECGDQVRESAFSNLLANMAHDMGKNLCPHGYMVVLQSMAEVYPSLCVNNPTRFCELMRSYQNRPNIATALMWALGQGGRKDLAIGLKAWTEFLSELVQYRNYSRFVTDYLAGLLDHHSERVRKGGRVLFSGQFFKIFDVVFGTAAFPNLGRQYKARLLELYPVVKAVSVGDCKEDHELFPEFLRRLGAYKQRESSAGDGAAAAGTNFVESALREECLLSLTQCLSNNPAALRHWQQMYSSYLPASAELLAHVAERWGESGVGTALKRNAEFRETLEAFAEHNEGVVTQKEGLAAASANTKVKERLALEYIDTRHTGVMKYLKGLDLRGIS